MLIAAMIVLTLAVVVLLWRIRRSAALLMLPYLAWIAFAAALTFSVAQLNPNASEVAPQPATTDIIL